MPYEVCEKCYGTKNAGHKCGPATLAKDDLCPKCLIVLDDCSKSVGHYSKDMLQISRTARDESQPVHKRLVQIQDILEKRERRILAEMDDGRIKRS